MALEPVFAPDVPVEVRRLYERRPELFVPARQPRPKRGTSLSRVLGATVTQRGLLDEMQNELVLPEQLWDIGQVLHEQSVLRARQRDVARGMATAELEAVLGPQRRALTRSADAIKRKVELLERYA